MYRQLKIIYGDDDDDGGGDTGNNGSGSILHCYLCYYT